MALNVEQLQNLPILALTLQGHVLELSLKRKKDKFPV